jgi:nitroreductase
MRDIQLEDALRTTAAVREFTDDVVDDDVVRRVLETARFSPSGGNGQGWHVVLVKDPGKRRRLRDLYLVGWYEYLAMREAGLRPWSPVNDHDAEAVAVEKAASIRDAAARGPGGFAEHLDEVPVLLALFADLAVIAAVDRDAERYSFAGGASVYPFAWSVLLAARLEGLGGVITTMCVRAEAEVQALVGAPEGHALAAVIALGRPVHQVSKLRRADVDTFASVDDFTGPAIGGAPPASIP